MKIPYLEYATSISRKYFGFSRSFISNWVANLSLKVYFFKLIILCNNYIIDIDQEQSKFTILGMSYKESVVTLALLVP